MIQVVLLTDGGSTANKIRKLLGAAPDVRITGESDSIESLAANVQSMSADIALLDLDGLSCATLGAMRTQTKATSRFAHVILLGNLTDEYIVGRLLRSGAKGYLINSLLADELVNAIRTVYGGQRFLSRPLCDAMAFRYVDDVQSTNPQIVPSVHADKALPAPHAQTGGTRLADAAPIAES